ncbi:copper homeostasis protein cutC homolog [Trichonephila inaurata madagascariensis]|uniref:Copper homeostasis protein cutC homolog n=1 Tax=Trichonephila inaurata madagascariensis TaxID=2747483 RepID=A0A8X6XQE5_9ARAC|nr:copper homeostasis protein cutC homolog [Trichonephila inaurata madagascariensis]
MSQISTILFLSTFNFATGMYPMECCSNCIDKGPLSYRSTKMNYQLEICTDNLLSAITAARSGADRLELSQGLNVGGLTPSTGFLRMAKINIKTIPIFMVVRPRTGNYVYTKDEIEQMIADMKNSLQFGIDGFVTGALTNDGKIDRESCDALIKAAGDKPVTFHRAFDLTRRDGDIFDIMSLGFKRILTSGRRNRASEGIPLIKKLVLQVQVLLT